MYSTPPNMNWSSTTHSHIICAGYTTPFQHKEDRIYLFSKAILPAHSYQTGFARAVATGNYPEW